MLFPPKRAKIEEQAAAETGVNHPEAVVI
jgi:hypothetical protein